MDKKVKYEVCCKVLSTIEDINLLQNNGDKSCIGGGYMLPLKFKIGLSAYASLIRWLE